MHYQNVITKNHTQKIKEYNKDLQEKVNKPICIEENFEEIQKEIEDRIKTMQNHNT